MCSLATELASKYTEYQDDKALGLCFLPLVRLLLAELQVFMNQAQSREYINGEMGRACSWIIIACVGGTCLPNNTM